MTYYVKTVEINLKSLTDWLYDADIRGEYYHIWSDILSSSGYCWLFEFEHAKDAVAFKLRWG